MFEEAVQQMDQAFAVAEQCDLLLVLGTSGVVYPAAAIPYQAKDHNARIIEINPTDNYYASVSSVYLPAPSGQALPQLVDLIKDLL